ncbi:hypothetical protein [Erythrobacter sp. F6033]|uniref:hypothetical protein n=1 Tax=Erythrobacter sp. F6033 TaxID=2926401 RepID=UPI001FF4D026|nr:hypothetical protein [Erythrobacter sp. F6033]MCK0128864.1 hypothetical protein [Erythrobacter sp. F6033]
MEKQLPTGIDSNAPDLDPRDGTCIYGNLTNPNCGLTVRMTSSPYGGDGFHVSWKVDAYYKATLTEENALNEIPLQETGPYKNIKALYGIGGATHLLRLSCSERYPDDNLWLFIKGNAIQERGQHPRDVFYDPIDGPFSAEQIFRYTLQSCIHLMRNQRLWEYGGFRLFIPDEQAERIGGVFGEHLRPRIYGEKEREYCEVLYEFD